MKGIRLLLLGLVFYGTFPIFAQTQIAKGRELFQQGKIIEARAELYKVINQYPKNEDAWLLLGETYLKTGQLDSAVISGEKVIRINKKNIHGYYFLSKVKRTNRDFIGANSVIRLGLVNNKNNPALLTELGYALLEADSADEALVAFSTAKEIDPENPIIYNGLGDAYVRQGIISMGVLSYEKSLELDSLNTSIRYKIAKAYSQDRRYAEAAQTYLKIVQSDTTNLEAVLELGKLFYSAKQYANAARFLHRYLRQAPDSPPAVLEQYMEAAYLGKFYEDASDAAKQYLKSNPLSLRAQQIIIHALFESKQYNKVIESYLELSNRDTLTIDELKRLGKSYLYTNQDLLAENIFQQVIEKDSAQADAYGDLGAIYMRMKKWDQAATMFEKRFEIDSTSISAYINFALSNMVLEKWGLAQQALRHARRLKPDYLPIHLYLGNVLMQIDSLSQARKEYQNVIDLADTAVVRYKNELADAHKSIGLTWLLEAAYIKVENDGDRALRSRKLTQALDALNNSLRLRNSDAPTHLSKAQTLNLLSRRDEAIVEYNIVLKLDPKNKTAQDDLEGLGQ